MMIKVAVFGHFDSRGGTMAMQINTFTEEAIRNVIARYDEEVFGIERPGDRMERTTYGMPARDADKAAHRMLYGDNSPGLSDLMYVAELRMPEEFVPAWNEIEDSGFDVDESEEWVVLRDEITGGPPDLEWVEIKEPNELGIYWQAPVEPGKWIEMVAGMPVNLEILRRPADILEHLGDQGEHRFWKAHGSKLKEPIHPNWNDDAYGFILMPDRSIK